MALAKEDLQAIRDVVREEIKEQLIPIKEELTEIKEHTEITRSATNSLVDWADNVSVVTQIKFPVEKQAK